MISACGSPLVSIHQILAESESQFRLSWNHSYEKKQYDVEALNNRTTEPYQQPMLASDLLLIKSKHLQKYFSQIT